jgi:hypothetical protein
MDLLELNRCDGLKEFNGLHTLEHWSALSPFVHKNKVQNFPDSPCSVALYPHSYVFSPACACDMSFVVSPGF